ncbi:hypothetical protein EBS43_12865, partial [bacterium]|nr:hypothetical protein [bacterium]
KIYEGGDITGADKLKIEELLTELPKAEIRNCLAKAQEFLDNGDQASAKSWQAEVDSRIRSYRNGGLDPKDTSEFLARSKELFSKAYAEKSTQESESSAERQEGDELLTVEEQRGLLKRLLQEKIYGREMSEHKDKNPDLAEQIKKLAENGMLENLSLDLKTGRIHFKYKPKSRSILGFFADYLMNTDKRIAEDRKRLLQGTSMAKFGTGISSKLDKPFGSHAKEARDEFESLREAGIEVEKDGENVSLSFDQESQEGKAAVEALSKMINKKDESESDLEIGNFVQWNSSGASQWEVPRKIEKFSDDGKFAFFEGSATGIPVEQLSVEEKPTKKEDDLDKGKKESPDDKER